ncbi:hypothetical protein LMH87_012163 [Akanthomyces muscarius]|uniref:Xylanolytic transcriptional activator regulatory domain-containing protein n=1 Tax=Akanthomyces muscarius TaxID=2231603 RepID=A0A9W8QBE1_AKAMU|nr:hypothetical protein LMH87_012163 [Akanthomyces muscarius]KAJ4151464.1 hypothetical protein LMH87_012163 [Akanthomyces muscarius]
METSHRVLYAAEVCCLVTSRSGTNIPFPDPASLSRPAGVSADAYRRGDPAKRDTGKRWSVDPGQHVVDATAKRFAVQDAGQSVSDASVPTGPASVHSDPGTSSDKATHSQLPHYSLDAGTTIYGIPTTSLYELIDIYFTHITNSALLLHKDSLLQQLANNQARDHVILSICALAAKRHSPDGSSGSLIWQQGLAHQWATRAGQLVFQELDNPREENIVTLTNLTLYWYEEGQWKRCSIYRGNALLIARVATTPNASNRASMTPFQAEMQRRRLWACYLMTAYSSEPHLQRYTFQLVKDIGLPCQDEDFNPEMASPTPPGSNERQSVSLAGELIKIICLWTKVCEVVQNKPRNMHSYLIAVQELDLAVSKWHQGLPSTYKGLDTTLAEEQATFPTVHLLHFFHHQCMCSLHASLVPLYCWGGLPNDRQPYPLAQQLSAQTALEHARSISELASSVLAGAYPVARSNSFVGYACYCACAVMIPFLRCADPAVKAQAHRDVLSNLAVMQALGQYWRFTKLLGANIQTIYRTHSQFTHCIDDEPKNMSPSRLEEASVEVKRVTLSVVGHNRILQGLADDEATNLGVGPVFNEDTISNLICEVKDSLQVSLQPQNFGAGDDATMFRYTAQSFVSQQQLEAINGCPFVFAGSIDYTLEDGSTFFPSDDQIAS